MNTPKVSTMDPQTKSRLCGLPPGLRNQIYALVFENPDSEVDLAGVFSPRTDILLACKQIHSEPKVLAHLPVRQYRQNTTFSFIKHSEASATKFTATELSNIRRMHHIKLTPNVNHVPLRLTVSRGGNPMLPWTLVADHASNLVGLWLLNCKVARLNAFCKAMGAQREAADLYVRQQEARREKLKQQMADGQYNTTSREYEASDPRKAYLTVRDEFHRNNPAFDLEQILNYCADPFKK